MSAEVLTWVSSCEYMPMLLQPTGRSLQSRRLCLGLSNLEVILLYYPSHNPDVPALTPPFVLRNPCTL